MQCVILAGGMGTRMLPLTSEIPKTLIDIDGNPFIYHQLNWLYKHGVTDILISVGHLGYMVKDYIGDGSKFPLSIDFVDEGERLRGTAGALRLAYEQDKLDDSFLITYGDSFLLIDFREIYHAFMFYNMPALMTIYDNQNVPDCATNSNVLIKRNNLILYDKYYESRPHADFTHIDYGVSVLSKKIIETRIPPDQKYKLEELFHQLSVEDLLLGYEVSNDFFEIGSFAGLKSFRDWVNGKRINHT